MLLITGATGYIGSHLVMRLLSQGEHPRCLIRNVNRAAQIFPSNNIELLLGDTTHPDTLTSAVQGVETIVHAAFVTADRKETATSRYEETNVGGTAHLIKAAQEAGVKRIIEISGLGTRPAKPGSYMQGRYQAEKMLQESGLDWTIIRPSVLFGGDAPFIKGLTELIRTSPVVPLIGGGKIKFQPIYVEDVATIILKVLADPSGTKGKIYTIGGPDYYTFTQIIDALLQATQKKRIKLPAPIPFVALGATAMEAVLPRPPLTKAAMTLFSFDNITDLDSVERDFAFKPLSFSSYLAEHGLS